MAEKKNQYLREKERRRRDLLELKALEEAAEPKVKEEYSSPKTFKEKLENFWYHNKWGVLAAAAVLLVAGICIGQLLTKPKYDCQVVLYLNSFVDKPTTDAMQAELEKYCPDVNGDGEANLLIVNCCIYENMQTNQLKDVLDRVQVQLMNPDSLIFIVDDNTIEQLDNTASRLFIAGDYPDLSGRGINLAGSTLDEAVQAADSADTFSGDYYIAARYFSEDSLIHPDEAKQQAALGLINGILAEKE